jgi:ferredoxin-type protein NapG
MAIDMDDRDRCHSLLTRRAFVGLVGNGIGVVALGGLIRFLEPNDFKFSRPPGAMVEEEFLSLCIRCDKCRKACPWDLISPVPLAKGIVNAGTPIVIGECRHCWLCIPVCPTRALRQ